MPAEIPSQADNQPTDTQPAPTPAVVEAPLDPRRAPDVLEALNAAARRDPHPDPLKTIGRSAFIIWLAIIGTLFFAAGPAHKYVDVPKFRTEVLMTYQGLIDSHPTPARTIKDLKRNPHKMEILAVTGFAIGSFVFALYYVSIYLIGMNARRLPVDAGRAIDGGVRRIAALRARMHPKPKGSTRIVVERTSAGPEPRLQ